MRLVAGLMVLALAALAAVAIACGSGGAKAGDRTAGAPPTVRALPSADVTGVVTPTAAATPAVAPSPTTEAAPPTVPPPPTGQPTSAPPRPAATPTPAPPPPPPPPSGQSLAVTARDLAFSPRGLTAHAGAPLTITLSNQDAGVRHDITVYGPGGAVVAETSIVEGPASASLTFTPSAGTYPFKCSVHFAMTGALSVQ